MRAQNWDEWEQEYEDDLKQIEEIQSKGHSHHCACRQVWGDGECECGYSDCIEMAWELVEEFDHWTLCKTTWGDGPGYDVEIFNHEFDIIAQSRAKTAELAICEAYLKAKETQ